jgi:hypothetical protein
MDGYINCLNSLAGEVIKKGGDQAELEKITIPPEYKSLLFPQFFLINLKFLYQRQIKGGSSLAREEHS